MTGEGLTERQRKLHASDYPACALVPWNWICQDNTETQVVVPIVRRKPAPVRRTAALGKVAPAAPAIDSARAANWTYRVTRWRLGVIVFIVPVLTPFPNVAVHIVKPPSVRFLLANRMSFTSAVGIVPAH